MNKDLDYSALAKSHGTQNPKFKFILLLAVYLMVFFATLTIVPVLWGGEAAAYAYLGLILGTPIAVKIVGLKKRLSARSLPVSEDKIARFAVTNYARLIRDKVPSYSGRIFTSGFDRKIEEALRFNDGREIGNYQSSYYRDNFWSRSVIHWGYVKIPLKRNLPHTYLDARNTDFWLNYHLLTSRVDTHFPFEQDQRVQLEGDFNKYFTLYVPNGYGRDALYIFTPDVMAALVDHGKKYDVEIIDNELYFYSETPFPLGSPDFYKRELHIFSLIENEIAKQADNYADDRVFDSRRLNVITEQGATLGNASQIKSGLILGGILTLACTLIAVILALFMY